MDVATLIGLLTGTVLLGYAVMSTPGSSPGMFVNYPSMAVVIGGAMAASLISAPMSTAMAMFKVLRNAFLHKSRPANLLIKEMVRYAEVARRDGILSLEGLTAEMSDPFLIKGIRLAVDGTDPEQTERILTAELDCVEERHTNGRRIFETLGKYAPAFGMIGTLIGLIVMLSNMQDPDALGPGMAVALITTLYGALIANLIFLPIADKLACRSREELATRELIIRGILSIQTGDNPRVVEQKLQTFLPPRLRKGEEEEEEGRRAA
jgi:chemotaxis protein MotA